MQLVAYGAQDVYLSGNPQITFFKVVYRRHTNFSFESIQQTWNNQPNFGRTVSCIINKNGDLITSIYVSIKFNNIIKKDSWGFVRRLGHALIESCKIEIGGSKIDEHYGNWLNIWYELTHKTGQENSYANMIGDVPELTNINKKNIKPYQMYIPLQFWFNRNNGLALPLIALQYHEVRITLKFRSFSECINYAGTADTTIPSDIGIFDDSFLLIDYIYLDSEERKRFAQASHEYLIEQLQFTGSETLTAVNSKYKLNFYHPCKYLIWAIHLERYYTSQYWITWANSKTDWKNASERFAKILYIATRNNIIKLDNGFWIYGYTVKNGDLMDFLPNSNLKDNILDLLKKIEVKVIITNDDSAEYVYIGDNADDVLENIVVLKNNLIFEDLSKNIKQLVDGGVNQNILNYYSYRIVDYFNYGNFINGSDNPVYNAKLQLNGHDRFQDRDGHYFNYVQPSQHFTNTPADGINVYSFALKAEDHQPTGTCNFSRIDNATLNLQIGLYNNFNSNYITDYLGNLSSIINIYTQNYNVLRVMSGMAGTAYNN